MVLPHMSDPLKRGMHVNSNGAGCAPPNEATHKYMLILFFHHQMEYTIYKTQQK